jgi:TPR repeat protein
MYHDGEGVSRDYAEAIAWYQKAAERGDVKAQYNLGEAYHKGEGVSKNNAEAVRWYRMAAEQGHAKAKYCLGVMYHNGEGVPKDYVEAYFWLSLAGTTLDEKERADRDEVGAKLTAAMRIEVQGRCRRWMETHPAIPE